MIDLRIAIVGAGRMGRGIALAFASEGADAVVIDIKPRDAAQTRRLTDEFWREIDADLGTMCDLGLLERPAALAARHRICLQAGDRANSLAGTRIVFEAVPEVLKAKQEAMGWINERFADDTPVASTTSSHLVSELATMIAQPQRFLNAHWLNPGHIMPLVELSRHANTDGAVLACVQECLERIGKVVVICGASPGYIVPRLQTLLMNEAARMVTEGVASAEDIDKATRYGLGLRFAAMGVVEFIDFGGNDILYHASRYLQAALANERFASPPVVAEMMAANTNGLRDGHGFFDYRSIDVDAYRRDVLRRVCATKAHLGLGPTPLPQPG